LGVLLRSVGRLSIIQESIDSVIHRLDLVVDPRIRFQCRLIEMSAFDASEDPLINWVARTSRNVRAISSASVNDNGVRRGTLSRTHDRQSQTLRSTSAIRRDPQWSAPSESAHRFFEIARVPRAAAWRTPGAGFGSPSANSDQKVRARSSPAFPHISRKSICKAHSRRLTTRTHNFKDGSAGHPCLRFAGILPAITRALRAGSVPKAFR